MPPLTAGRAIAFIVLVICIVLAVTASAPLIVAGMIGALALAMILP